MTTVVLDGFVEDSMNNDDVYSCFKCGTQVPEHLVVCWNCGEVLDENIRRLSKKE